MRSDGFSLELLRDDMTQTTMIWATIKFCLKGSFVTEREARVKLVKTDKIGLAELQHETPQYDIAL